MLPDFHFTRRFHASAASPSRSASVDELPASAMSQGQQATDLLGDRISIMLPTSQIGICGLILESRCGEGAEAEHRSLTNLILKLLTDYARKAGYLEAGERK
jgi:hypothetical protein